MQARAPFPWFGGKQYLVSHLLSLLPPHDVYVEVFGGAGSLLFNKLPSRLEIYNDIDSGVVGFFRVLRDPTQFAQLKQSLDLTPFSREEWMDCRNTWQDVDDPVERARRWWVQVVQSFSGASGRNHGWKFSTEAQPHKPQNYRRLIEALPRFSERLSCVQIEHGNYQEMFARYDAPDVCFYCDPPYLPETRRTRNEYAHEMSYDEHLRFLETVRADRGRVLVSGYDSALYAKALGGWQCIRLPAIAWVAPHVNGIKQNRVECIWLSPNAIQQDSLFGEECFAEEEVS